MALALGMLLVAASTATWAFDEQSAKSGVPASAERGKSVDGRALDFKGPDSRSPDTGTKIRIPGLGVVGEIPKIDLGLDLLYGATDPKRSDAERGADGNGAMLRARIPLQTR